MVTDGPADQAGIKTGDIITEIEGQSIDATHLLEDTLVQFAPGRTISIQLLRGSEYLTVRVTLDPKLAKKVEDISLPAGAQPFNSGDLSPGVVFRQKFTVPGTYRYICIPHEGMGMIGEIEVK